MCCLAPSKTEHDSGLLLLLLWSLQSRGSRPAHKETAPYDSAPTMTIRNAIENHKRYFTYNSRHYNESGGFKVADAGSCGSDLG